MVVSETKSGSKPSSNEIQIFLHSRQENYKNYQMSGKINSHICLMLSVYKKFHQTGKYSQQRNRILQDLTGFKI